VNHVHGFGESMKKYALLAMALGMAACHPLGCYHPKELPSDKPFELKAAAEGTPAADVEIMVDDLGIPHIFGESEPDLAYGLGYMHGRDRTWQLLFMRHVGQGRLTELFGESFLSADQFLRMNSFAADRILASFSPRTRAIVDAYVAGVNLAAAERGPTAEMDILGVEFGEMQPRDVVTILLHFVYDQSQGSRPELARGRVLNRLGPDHPVAQLLLSGTPSGGNPITTDDTHSGTQPGIQAQTPRVRSTTYRRADRDLPRKAARPELDARTRKIVSAFFTPQGHSNSWALSGDLTSSGAPILSNDPHLGHQAPGIFYFAHLEGPDFSITGGTFPGAPAILIGYGREIAWGITNAYGDCEDLVEIERVEGADDLYVLDGRPMNFGHVVQQYKLGKEDDAPIFEETWETTVFGPLLPPGRHFLLDEGDDVAYQWTAIQFADRMDGDLSMWWDLGKATNIEEADAALERFVSPPMSFVLAFTDGTIAQRVVGDFPARRSSDPIHLPRDGRFSNAGWDGAHSYADKPQLTNPESGIIIAANQRIVDDDSALRSITGVEGGNPFRALRIRERLETLVDQKRPNANDVFEIQHDSESVEARALAPLLGARCPSEIGDHPRERVLGFCTAIRNFDGVFTTDSLGALPYQLTMTRLVREVGNAHFGAAGRSPTRPRCARTSSTSSRGKSPRRSSTTRTSPAPTTPTCSSRGRRASPSIAWSTAAPRTAATLSGRTRSSGSGASSTPCSSRTPSPARP
jgi:penicillin amidase